MDKPFNPRAIRAWTSRFGAFPDDYLCVDCETTGLDPVADRILQFGIVIVVNRKPALSKTMIVNWPSVLSEEQLAAMMIRMERTRAAMAATGKTYPWTMEMLSRLGESPTAVANELQQTFGETPFCVGHNAWNFDYPRIFNFLKTHSTGFDTYQEHLYDTCQMTRACFADRPIREAQPLSSYYQDIMSLRGLPKATLEACVDFFGLVKQGVAMDHGHKSADYDAWASHLIFERHRRAADAKD